MTRVHPNTTSTSASATVAPTPMRTMAITLVRLKWSLMVASLRTSPWQVVALVIGCLLAAGALLGTAVGAVMAGSTQFASSTQWATFMPTVMVIGGTLSILMVVLMQIMVFGESSTMTMSKFAPFGIPDRTLQYGLILAALSGIAPLTLTVCLLMWAAAYRSLGVTAIVAQLLMAPCIVILAVCFCKTVLAVVDVFVDSAGGKSTLYVLVMLIFITLCQLPSVLTNGGITMSMAALATMTQILAWLPLGCLFQVPFDVAQGSIGLALTRIAIGIVFTVLCFLVSSWCLRHQRRTLGGSARSGRTVSGFDVFSRMPDTPSGAISARILTILRRDVRQAMFLLIPVLFVVLFSLEARTVDVWFPFIGALVGGWVVMIGEANGLSYDGRGFTMQIIAGVDGRTDRRGRIGAYVRLLALYFVFLGVLAGVLGTVVAHSPQNWLLGITLTVTGFGWALAGLGVAEVLNCTMLYPVPTLEKPFANPQGRMVAQVFIPFLYLIAAALTMLPTAIAAIVFIGVLEGVGYPWIMLVAVANGAGICALGNWWSARLLNTRMLVVLHPLERNASLQQ